MEGLANFVVGLFKDLRLPFRWVAIISIGALIVVGLFAYERLTGHFYFTRLEKKITLLKELQSLKQDGISEYPELLPIYESMVSDLNNYDSQKVNIVYSPSLDFSSATTWWKALSGASIWLLVIIFFTISEVRNKKFSGTTLGGIFLIFIFAVIMGFLGAMIPTIVSPIVNYFCFPLLQVLLLVWLAVKSASKSSKPVST